MPNISILDRQTIDQIAAGEVVERPSSVVKELVENAIDAKAGAITVEIKEGGISFIRITDNGCGIDKEEIPLAFLRHSTSKIKTAKDLLSIASLGFRGEALSSIAAVAQVELITKTPSEISGVRYCIDGGEEISLEEIGAPGGSTFLVRNLFYNTPVRRNFLKTPATEGAYISDLIERLALSHPEVSFKFISNNQVKFQTTGNSNVKEIIYQIYGREVAGNLIPIKLEMGQLSASSLNYVKTKAEQRSAGDINPVKTEAGQLSIEGFIGKPLLARGNRNFETYFVNGRYVKSNLIAKAIEEGYGSFLMQHKYPFAVLFVKVLGDSLDVNVHPTKMELRISNEEQVYECIKEGVRRALNKEELIYPVELGEKEKEEKGKGENMPEPFETKRLASAVLQTDVIQGKLQEHLSHIREKVRLDSPYEAQYQKSEISGETSKGYGQREEEILQIKEGHSYGINGADSEKNLQLTLSIEDNLSIEGNSEATLSAKLLTEAAKPQHKILGQLFSTYWLVELSDTLYIIDQHAAHEKVLYERLMVSLAKREYTSQNIVPPLIITLSMTEEELLNKYRTYFEELGFVIEHFGGKEYAVTAVPDNLFGLNQKELMLQILDDLGSLQGKDSPDLITEKIASMSCKAAVKGNQSLSEPELKALIDELLTLENPYHCPHGRPTIISMTRYELEKKFKRIV
ncbi:DNA mismatch repair protein MutL [Clostridia bacterium]|nr:DNA mismatch repair protein MutL [Clostridia bacterium]